MTVCYPTQRLVLVLDNASLATLSLFQERIQVIWLPKYSPLLNPIERFWLQLKNRASANQLHISFDMLDTAIGQVIANQNAPEHADRLEFRDQFQLIA